MRTLVCDPQTEIIGQAMLAIVENLQTAEIKPFRVKYNLEEIIPDKWYPASNFLAALYDLNKSEGGMSNMVAIGMAVTDKMVMPPELVNAPLPVILNLWNDLYHLQHRNGEIGYVKTEQLSENHIRTSHKHLYPDDMTYGLAYGMAKRFLPQGTHFTVTYDPNAKRIDDGGEITIIDVDWA